MYSTPSRIHLAKEEAEFSTLFCLSFQKATFYDLHRISEVLSQNDQSHGLALKVILVKSEASEVA